MKTTCPNCNQDSHATAVSLGWRCRQALPRQVTVLYQDIPELIEVRIELNEEDEARRQMVVAEGMSHATEYEIAAELISRNFHPDRYLSLYGRDYAEGEAQASREDFWEEEDL